MNNLFMEDFRPERFRDGFHDGRFGNFFFPFATGLLLGAAIDGPGYYHRPYPYYPPYAPYPPFITF